MAVKIEVKGAKELVAKLTTLAKMEKVRAQIDGEAEYLRGLLQEYPANAHGPNPLLHGKGDKANKMRRGFFWHLKNGDISVPYKRQYDLQASWKVTKTGAGWVASVESNNVAYNSWVQGSDQTTGHANSGWLTVDKAKEDNEAGIIERITAALEEEVADVG